MTIRILHVVDTVAVGGLQNGLANIIARLDYPRFEHIVCGMRSVEPERMHPFGHGAQVICLPAGAPGSHWQLPALIRVLRRFRPNIVHTRNWGTVEGQIAARGLACGRIHSEHGVDWETAVNEPRRRVFLRRVAFELADRVLAVSQNLRDLHAARTGFPADRIAVIHNGVDCARFFPDPAARDHVRRELGIHGSDFCIGCVGNLIPVKDHMTLLRGIELLARECGNWRLLIVGDGPEREHLAGYIAASSRLNGRVCFVGMSNHVPKLLNALDVYVLSSVTEGISNSVLEAMATGLPVAVTATGGNPEVVEDAQSGLVFAVGDAQMLAGQLLSLYARSSLRSRLAQHALERVRKHFSVDSMARAYEQVYREVALRVHAASSAFAS
jgi:sugar transferase (PEP-CTERM/EpsH1 system associated)